MAITTLFLTGVELSARMYRGLVTDLFGEGIRNVANGEFQVIPRALGANMTVTVRKGTGPDAVAYIVGDDVTGQGTYRVTMDADFLDLGIAAAPASGTRTDLVVLESVDSQVVGGSTNLSRLRVLTGVSALTTEKTVIPLARISVPAGTTSIQAANITDLRTASTGGGAAVRAIAPPYTTAQIAALTPQRIGELATNTDTGRVLFWNGTAWRPVGGVAYGTTVLPTLSITTTYQTLAFFIGLGFEEVQATIAYSGFGGTISAVADATRATGVGAIPSGGSVPGAYAFALNSTTETGQIGVNNNSSSASVYVRNIRLDADGYLRFEMAAISGTVALGTTGSTKMTWRAR